MKVKWVILRWWVIFITSSTSCIPHCDIEIVKISFLKLKFRLNQGSRGRSITDSSGCPFSPEKYGRRRRKRWMFVDPKWPFQVGFFSSDFGSSLKWTVLSQTGRAMGVQLNGPNDYKWTVFESERSKGQSLDDLRIASVATINTFSF